MSGLEVQEREAGWGRWVVPGGVSVLSGEPKSGKPWLMLGLLLSWAEGRPFLGFPTPGGVVAYAHEDSVWVLAERLSVMGRPRPGRAWVMPAEGELTGAAFVKSLDRLEELAGETPGLVVVDVIAGFVEQGADANEYSGGFTDLLRMLNAYAQRTGAAVLCGHHDRKSAAGGGGQGSLLGTTGIAGSVDVVLGTRAEADGRKALFQRSSRIGPEADPIPFHIGDTGCEVLTHKERRDERMEALFAGRDVATVTQAAEIWAVSRQAAQKILDGWAETGAVSKEKRGRRFEYLRTVTGTVGATGTATCGTATRASGPEC